MKRIQVKEYKEVPYNYTGIVEYSNGSKRWLVNGYLHREDGPAIEWSDGRKEWYLNGERHREDGPAAEYLNGTKEWYLNGKSVSKKIVELHYMLKYKKIVKL